MNVLIIEDHPITAMGLKMLVDDNFEKTEVDIAHNGKSALKMAKDKAYHLIILDISLPQTDTQKLLENLTIISKGIQILICSNHDANIYAMPYISVGASGFVHKSSSEQEIVSAIKSVIKGQMYIEKEVLMNNLNHKTKVKTQNKPINNIFSSRELEVFTHLMEGKRIKDISEIMNIHQSTASTLKKRIMEKANVDNLIDLKNLADDIVLK